MQFSFDVDGTTVEFSRNWFTGRCTLHTGTRDEVLQSSLNPFTHYSVKLKRQWHVSVEPRGHHREGTAPAVGRTSAANLSGLRRLQARSEAQRILDGDSLGARHVFA